MEDFKRCLSDTDREILEAVVATAIPQGRILPGGGKTSVDRLERFLSEQHPASAHLFKALAWSMELGSIPRFRRPFRRLKPDDRLRYLRSYREGNVFLKFLLRVLMVPLKISHFDDPEIFEAIGCEYTQPEIQETPPRWMSQVQSGAELERDETVEAEVVVVGTGAGGAVVARELAEKGHAVVMLEEGRYYTRKDFTGTRIEQARKMYRDLGLTVSMGNVPIVVPVGCCVGGSTTINSGTCYRAPDWILGEWRERIGLSMFTPEHLDPYYRRVEGTLKVEPVKPEVLGGMARVMARGCDRLNYRHGPLQRNAPDCEGKGLCCFGCPTDAKRSTNISYVPAALKRGAVLYTDAFVEKILTERGRAVGVNAVCTREDGSKVRLTVRADITVVACGTLFTPWLLQRSSVGTRNPVLGANLSLHPSTSALALFDETIEGWNGVPQGYAVEEFHREGILIEGAFAPLDYGSMTIPLIGPILMELMESYGNTANFGFMIRDSSRGRVRPGIAGRPLITYNMNRRDVALMHRALIKLCEIYFAAGAKTVFPIIQGFEVLRSPDELEPIRNARLKPHHFEMIGFHPLGTARMGLNPATSVVDHTHETHEVKNLFIADGSVVPTSLAVNPQITIMTLATRAADFIDRRLS